MRVLVVGSGGREHAICRSLSLSQKLKKLFCAPGNGGIAALADCRPVAATDLDGILSLCEDEAIDFVVVGPEDPLVAGLVDRLNDVGIPSFGPTAAGAILEGSKSFTKDFCKRHQIPTAAYEKFTNIAAAKSYIEAQGAPIVVKADGLAAGKGAIVCETLSDALQAAEDILGGQFGAAGNEIVVEEFMVGEEASFFAICDGKTALPLVTAQDHKRVGDGDVGPNTGGMGTYSPAPVMTDEMISATIKQIIQPTLKGMAGEGRTFKGILYAGLMITDTGPKLIEYNTRFGDPECQVILPRLKSDLLEVFCATAEERLEDITLDWSDDTAVCVVMAADGYPGAYEKGTLISGLDKAGALENVYIYHAGTLKNEAGDILANGGRVLGVTALGDGIRETRDKAYVAVSAIDWPDGFCRQDIAYRALARETE